MKYRLKTSLKYGAIHTPAWRQKKNSNDKMSHPVYLQQKVCDWLWGLSFPWWNLFGETSVSQQILQPLLLCIIVSWLFIIGNYKGKKNTTNKKTSPALRVWKNRSQTSSEKILRQGTTRGCLDRRAVVTGDCELPNSGVKSWTQVLWKSRECP